jgi:3-carboxy-cis,cis-muconate cycloisomerase
MRPSSSGSEPGLFGPVLARGGAADEVTDGAWLSALLEVEAALAAAAADIGIVDRQSAEAVASACADATTYDAGAIGAAAAATGTPVLALADAIRAAVPESARGAVHVGATSQDVLDTAMMLVVRRAAVPVVADLAGAADAAAGLAAEHRNTVMAGRTLGQQAVPVTFGLVCAQWMTGLDGSADRLATVARALPLQYGGAAGTRAAADRRGSELAARLAERLDLRDPVLPWHTIRLPVADLAGALGTACGIVAKVAGDVVLLAQTEVAELSDADPARGGSSAMAHKANPVAAVSARACARRGPGLVATLLGAMEQEHQRAAGAWHSEWRTLTDLLVATGSAAAWLHDCLEHLVVHADRMAGNLTADLRDVGPGDAAALTDLALREHDSHVRPR